MADIQRLNPKDVVFIFNNKWFVLRTLMVESPREDGLFGDYYKFKDGTFQFRIGQLLFYTKRS